MITKIFRINETGNLTQEMWNIYIFVALCERLKIDVKIEIAEMMKLFSATIPSGVYGPGEYGVRLTIDGPDDTIAKLEEQFNSLKDLQSNPWDPREEKIDE